MSGKRFENVRDSRSSADKPPFVRGSDAAHRHASLCENLAGVPVAELVSKLFVG